MLTMKESQDTGRIRKITFGIFYNWVNKIPKQTFLKYRDFFISNKKYIKLLIMAFY